MAKKTDSRCSVCGAIVGPGVRFCSYFCKISAYNDKLLEKHKTKPKRKKKSKKKS